MRDAGIIPTCPIIPDGVLHRTHVENDRAGTLNLAYVLHLDSKPAGWWQYFKTGISGTWSASGKREPMTATMKKQIDDAKQQRQFEQAKAHQDAALKAQWIWGQATVIATLKAEARQHQYLITKRIKPHGARLYHDALVIPLIAESGVIVNLQFIAADGQKRFLSGGRKKGCFAAIGEPTETILIVEGFATGASLHESTGKQTIIAFDAGNLEAVGRAIRAKYPDAEIIIAGDNDESGIGQLKANAAALAIGGKVLIPPKSGMDWNDYVIIRGTV